MGKKASKGEEKKKEGGNGGKKDDGPIAVVLKLDMHCEGCADKVRKSIRGFEGVEGVKAEVGSGKLTVVGRVDPWNVRDRVESDTGRKVELLSPTNFPNKDKSEKGDQKKASTNDKKPKEKEPTVSTVVLKIQLHCEGCSERIRKTISRIKGVENVAVDGGKDLVTVKGMMDAKALPDILREKLKRAVEVVAPKKGGGGEKKEKGGSGEGAAEEGGKGAEAGGKAAEASMVDYSGGAHRVYVYPIAMAPAPQLFSDENPNACAVM